MPTYTKITYQTTTPLAEAAGRRIMANDTTIYANSEEYYADGSVVMRNIVSNHPEIKCNNTTIKCNDRWTVLCNGCLPYTKETHS